MAIYVRCCSGIPFIFSKYSANIRKICHIPLKTPHYLGLFSGNLFKDERRGYEDTEGEHPTFCQMLPLIDDDLHNLLPFNYWSPAPSSSPPPLSPPVLSVELLVLPLWLEPLPFSVFSLSSTSLVSAEVTRFTMLPSLS